LSPPSLLPNIALSQTDKTYSITTSDITFDAVVQEYTVFAAQDQSVTGDYYASITDLITISITFADPCASA